MTTPTTVGNERAYRHGWRHVDNTLSGWCGKPPNISVEALYVLLDEGWFPAKVVDFGEDE